MGWLACYSISIIFTGEGCICGVAICMTCPLEHLWTSACGEGLRGGGAVGRTFNGRMNGKSKIAVQSAFQPQLRGPHHSFLSHWLKTSGITKISWKYLWFNFSHKISSKWRGFWQLARWWRHWRVALVLPMWRRSDNGTSPDLASGSSLWR